MAKKIKVWDSLKVEEYNTRLNAGIDLDTIGDSPYYMGMYGWRNGDIIFNYTPEEIEEIKKCKKDVLYFADKFSYAMTDDGVSKIKLRKYQRRVLRNMQLNRLCIVLASRQIGKCLQFNSKINIKNKLTNKVDEIYIYELWYENFKSQLKDESIKNKIIFYLKYKLYQLYTKL